MAATTTLHELIVGLTDMAGDAPAGMETVVRFGVCDGKNLQMLDHVDLDFMTEVDEGGTPKAAPFAIFKAHHHPGETPGPLWPGVASDVDDELRALNDEAGE